MSRTMALAAALLAAGCSKAVPPDSSPRSLNECLLLAVQKPSAEAIVATERICRETFPSSVAAELKLGSALYYLAGTGKCAKADLRPDGTVEGGFGLCSDGARFERSGKGELFFTCVLPTGAEPPTVYQVSESADVLDLHAIDHKGEGLPQDWKVSKTLAECSLSTTDEDRQLAAKVAAHGTPEWLAAPLAVWKSNAERVP